MILVREAPRAAEGRACTPRLHEPVLQGLRSSEGEATEMRSLGTTTESSRSSGASAAGRQMINNLRSGLQ